MKPIIPSVTFDHYLSFDWGYSEKSKFAAYLSAVIPMTTNDGQKFRRVLTYKEWAGNQKSPDEWARIIYEDCKRLGIRPVKGIGDSAMFNTQTDGSKAISDLMREKWKELNKDPWVLMERGTRNRIERVATVHNWLSIGPDDLPYWMITDNCTYLIHSLPTLIYDDNKIDDINTDSDDHGYDSISYFLARIPFVSIKKGTINYKTGPVRKRVEFTKDGDQIPLKPSDFAESYK